MLSAVTLGVIMRAKLGDMLVQAGVLTPEAVTRALDVQRREKLKRRLGEILVDLRLTTETRLLEVLSAALRFPVVDLDRETPTEEALALLTHDEALKALVLPLRLEHQGSRRLLVLVMADPANLATVDLLQFKLGLAVRPVLTTARQIRRAIAAAYGPTTTAAIGTAPGESTWVGRLPGSGVPARTRAGFDLYLRGGPRDGERVPLPRGQALVFGRASEADIVIHDMYLSRRHVQITHRGDAVEVIDLGSSNGTMLNGRAVTVAQVGEGDRIQVGTTVVEVVSR